MSPHERSTDFDVPWTREQVAAWTLAIAVFGATIVFVLAYGARP